MIYHLPFDSLDKAVIEGLVKNEAPEDRQLDFKLTLPGNGDGARKEFLADVTSFANAGGGALIFGVGEGRDAAGRGSGVAGSTPGLQVTNMDQAQLRLEQLILSGTSPRVPGIRFKWIELESGDPVLVLRIPASWASPHMVSLKGGSRFYSRNSKGKYQLDVQELRTAFLASEGLTNRIRRFRLDRLAAIVGGRSPVQTVTPPAFVLHALPLSAFSQERANPTFIQDVWEHRNRFGPPKADGWNGRWNLDGILLDEATNDGVTWSYTQIFRTGALEIVDLRFLHHCRESGKLFGTTFEHLVAGGLAKSDQLRTIGVAGPVVLAMSVIGVEGLSLGARERSTPIDRADLILPEIVVDEQEDQVQRFAEIVDMVWQASGFAGTPNRRADGSWFPGGRVDDGA